MSGELIADEPSKNAESAFKEKVFIPVLDTVIAQLKARFDEQDTRLMKEMQLFAPSSLLASKDVVTDDIRSICASYDLDVSVVNQELREFRPVYQLVHDRVAMDDMMNEKTTRGTTINDKQLLLETPNSAVYDEELFDDITGDVVENVENTEESRNRRAWVEYRPTFTKPLRVLQELSGFPNLNCLYRNLASLAVTSCSAERAMSRVKIVKNRLRSTMLDDWFSALLVLAAEKDLLDNINENDIIDRFAMCSLPLQKELIHGFSNN